MKGALFFLVGVLATQDGVPEQARRLIRQLDSPDIGTADDAARALVKLGADALPTLKAEQPRLTGETKLKVEHIIRRIERDRRAAAVMGRPALVTLTGERLLREHLENLKRQCGQDIRFPDLPHDRVRLDLRDVSHWKAIDEICRTHGKLDYTIGDSCVAIVAGSYRARPIAICDQFLFRIERIHFRKTHTAGTESGQFEIRALVARIRGTESPKIEWSFRSLTTDDGVDLGGDRAEANPGEEGTLCQTLHYSVATAPSASSRALVTARGRVVLSFVIEFEKLASIENPPESLNRTIPFAGGKGQVRLRAFQRSTSSAHMQVEVTRPREDRADALPHDFVLRDKKGRSIRTKVDSHGIAGFTLDGTRVMTNMHFVLSAPIPGDFEIAGLDVLGASDVEEVEIPFDFSGIRVD
ncbi:MAG: hypothetical protein HY716_16330 [Planctomycetes bacterium]|nr:hypothetical protein [Planctomycetota bacterium]